MKKKKREQEKGEKKERKSKKGKAEERENTKREKEERKDRNACKPKIEDKTWKKKWVDKGKRGGRKKQNKINSVWEKVPREDKQ